MKPKLILKRSLLSIKPQYLMEQCTIIQSGSVPKPIPVGSKVESTNRHGTVPTSVPIDPSIQIVLSAPVTKGNIQPRFDYIGQILYILGHTKLYNKEGRPVKLISDLALAIPPLSQIVRGVCVQTDLACTIMRLTPSPEGEKRLAALLADHWEIVFED